MSDAVFCGVWSGSALFVYVPQKGRYAYMILYGLITRGTVALLKTIFQVRVIIRQHDHCGHTTTVILGSSPLRCYSKITFK